MVEQRVWREAIKRVDWRWLRHDKLFLTSRSTIGQSIQVNPSFERIEP